MPREPISKDIMHFEPPYKSASMCSVYNEKCSLEATKVRWSKIQNKYNLTNTQDLYMIQPCAWM